MPSRAVAQNTRQRLDRAIKVILIVALLSGATLLAIAAIPLCGQFGPAIGQWARRQTPWLSAAPLLLSGFGLAGAQWVLKPPFGVVLKRLILSAAFILWGIVQLLPASDLSVELGNLVITLYVVDLVLIVRDELRAVRASARDHPAIDRHGDAGHV